MEILGELREVVLSKPSSLKTCPVKHPVISNSAELIKEDRRSETWWRKLQKVFGLASRAPSELALRRSCVAKFQQMWGENRMDRFGLDPLKDYLGAAGDGIDFKLREAEGHSINKYAHIYLENLKCSHGGANRFELVREKMRDKSVLIAASRLYYIDALVSSGAFLYGNKDDLKVAKSVVDSVGEIKQLGHACGPIVDVQLIVECLGHRAYDLFVSQNNREPDLNELSSLKTSILSICMDGARGSDERWRFLVESFCDLNEEKLTLSSDPVGGGRIKFAWVSDPTFRAESSNQYKDYAGCPAFHAKGDNGQNLLQNLVREYWGVFVDAACEKDLDFAQSPEVAACPFDNAIG